MENYTILSELRTIQYTTKNAQPQIQRWLAKWNSSFCSVERQLMQLKEQNYSQCLRCSTNNETITHVISCRIEEANTYWELSSQALLDWILQYEAISGLMEAIKGRLNN